MDSPDSLVSEGFGFVGELTWDVDGDFSLTVPYPFAWIHSRRRGDHVIVQGRVGLQINIFIDDNEFVSSCLYFQQPHGSRTKEEQAELPGKLFQEVLHVYTL